MICVRAIGSSKEKVIHWGKDALSLLNQLFPRPNKLSVKLYALYSEEYDEDTDTPVPHEG